MLHMFNIPWQLDIERNRLMKMLLLQAHHHVACQLGIRFMSLHTDLGPWFSRSL